VSDIEVTRPEPSYTILTLRHFTKTLPAGTEIVLLVGEDNLPMLHTWKDIDEILRLATLAIMPRPVAGPTDLSALKTTIGPEKLAGILANRVPTPLVPISATAIRARIKAGQSIAGLVPATIETYIAENGLYL
jgi:nicotinate-nucleotide adenylyltransferase